MPTSILPGWALTARRYIENMYGERTDSLNVGVPTDRLIAEWETSDTPAMVIAAEDIPWLPRLIDAGQGGAGCPGGSDRPDVGQAFQPDVRLESLTYSTHSSAASVRDTEGDTSVPHPQFLGVPAVAPPRLLLEIPQDISRLRRGSPPLAESWRVAVNRAFRASFAAGYRAISFVRDESSESRRLFYVLDRI